MNDCGDIQELIDRYFEGLTSLKEEERLREYFRGENVPEGWKIYQPLFQYFDEEKNNMESKSVALPSVRPRTTYLWFSVAACVLLFFGLKFIFPVLNSNQLLASSTIYINGKKYSDIELIQTESLKALENLLENRDDAYASQVEALELFFSNN